MTPEQQKQVKDAFDRAQLRYAEKAVAGCLPVYLWAGCHKLGGSLPDATDIPLVLVADSTVPGRTVYWAISATPPTHPEGGPFLPPPGKPI